MPRRRINKSEAAFLIAAALLPLAVVLFRWKMEAARAVTYQTIATDWGTCRLPGDITNTALTSSSGIHYISSTDSLRMAALAMVPLYEDSPLLAAISQNGKGIEKVFESIFFTLEIKIKKMTVLIPNAKFLLTGKIPENRQAFAAIISKITDAPYAAIILVGSDRGTDARIVCDDIADSIQIHAIPQTMPAPMEEPPPHSMMDGQP